MRTPELVSEQEEREDKEIPGSLLVSAPPESESYPEGAVLSTAVDERQIEMQTSLMTEQEKQAAQDYAKRGTACECCCVS